MVPPVRALREAIEVAKKVEVSSAGPLPFLKWAGGKRWLYINYPEVLERRFDRYIEPFLGSGAIFFHLQPEASILSDANADLIACYEAVRDWPEEVLAALRLHHCLHSKVHYYETRKQTGLDKVSAAARFIYLNRTCWNGLYRVNLKGDFNVPIGTKTRVVGPEDDFLSVSKLLRRAIIAHEDFEGIIDASNVGDFVFVDPPYTVKHDNNGFVKYNETIFSWSDQERLREAVVRAKRRGARVLVTNANHQSIRDLYATVGEIKVLSRSSVISGSAASRGKAEELIIVC